MEEVNTSTREGSSAVHSAYVVDHFARVRGGEAEARTTLVERCGGEAGDHHADAALEHLSTDRAIQKEGHTSLCSVYHRSSVKYSWSEHQSTEPNHTTAVDEHAPSSVMYGDSRVLVL